MKAIYAGSFDPISNGHLSVVMQARVCNWEEIIILVADNPDKDGWFTPEERVKLIQECLDDMKNVFAPTIVTVDTFSGLVVEYARQHDVDVLIRGVRGAMDITGEMGLAQVNKAVAQIPTVFFPADAALSEVSSSDIKKRIEAGESTGMFVMPSVYKALKERYNERVV